MEQQNPELGIDGEKGNVMTEHPGRDGVINDLRRVPVFLPPVPAGWRLNMGAELDRQGVSFRVWAPNHERLDVVLEGNHRAVYALARDARGYFAGSVPNIGPGTLYRYRVEGDRLYPDPCSRYQPDGPHGPSMVVDHRAYRWNDNAWPGCGMHGQVFYELHVGAFTPDGTLDGARRELAELKESGITVIELMPVAECPGKWNWGYDGVDLFAPSHNYGDYDALKRFVDEAHRLGIGVVLDVVYNHLGPDGCYLQVFSDAYFSTTHMTEWGQALNFDGPHSREVREFFIRNAEYWIHEFHMDGLRLDATQNIYDGSRPHILAEIMQRSRAVAGKRKVLLIAENEPQEVRCITPPTQGGYGFDALWDDDFHHTLRVALTGQREAYFVDYRGTPQELLSAVKRCFIYQGQYYRWQQKGRGSPVTGEPTPSFIVYLQNHDQIANHLYGKRMTALAGEELYRAAMAFVLLSPQTPLLFMGQEFGSSSPFFFFADTPSLSSEIYEGRKQFIAQFASYAGKDIINHTPDPSRAATFEATKLDLTERTKHAPLYRFHKDLLRLRRTDPVIRRQDRRTVDGAVLADRVFILRYSGGTDGDRLLVFNFGAGFELQPLSEPLLAAPAGSAWEMVWSSDDECYGGSGTMTCFHDGALSLPRAAAFLYASRRPPGNGTI